MRYCNIYRKKRRAGMTERKASENEGKLADWYPQSKLKKVVPES